MKILIKDLLPNPYRNMERNPISKNHVDDLALSIKDTDLWKGVIQVRKNEEGKYELIFGHHRVEAAKKEGLKEIDVTVADVSKQKLIRMMVDENAVVWGEDPTVTRESVRLVMEELEKELKDEKSTFYKFKKCKGKPGHPGTSFTKIQADDIVWYLGKAWETSGRRRKVDQALNEIRSIDEEEIDEKDLTDLRETEARALQRAMKKKFKKKAKTKKEKAKRKKAAKKVAKGLESGEIKPKEAEDALEFELSEPEAPGSDPYKPPRVTYSDVKLTFDHIIELCQKLEGTISKFKLQERDYHKLYPSDSKRFILAYDVSRLLVALQWIWDRFKNGASLSQALIENKGGKSDEKQQWS